MSGPRRIRLTFVAEAVSATATLREADAPETCAALWAALPVQGVAHHAVYSGSEAVLVLPTLVKADPENATSDVAKGDVGFTWFDAGSSFGVDEPFAEICWFYDDDARPSMHEGPVPVSLFARLDDGPEAEAFAAVSRRMRREGVKGLRVARVEGPEPEVVLAWSDPHCGAADPAVVVAEGDRVVVAFTEEAGGSGPAARSRRRVAVESRDGGRTWAQCEVPADGPVEHPPVDVFTEADGTPDGLPRLFARIERG